MAHHQYPNMYGQQQQQPNHKNVYSLPPPPGGNYYGWGGQPEYHHPHNLYQQPPPPPIQQGLHHHLPRPPPPPVHHQGYHHQIHQNQQQHHLQYPGYGGGGGVHHHQEHHHLQPYCAPPGFAPPPPPPPHLQHHHLPHNHSSISMDDDVNGSDDVLHEQQQHGHGSTLVDEVDDDDLNNLDPIEVLHPEQNLLAPPPNVLPPLEPTTVEEPSQPPPEDHSIHANITSPCKRMVCKREDEAVEEGEIANMEQCENKFVDGIFREPEPNTPTATGASTAEHEVPPTPDSSSNECALEASKSIDTVETTTTIAMGKPYYDTDGSRKAQATTSTDALLNHDDDAFLNNYRSFSEEDTMAPLKQDFENTTAPVYMPPTTTNTATCTIMDPKGDTVAMEYTQKQPKQFIAATPNDAENEPPQQQAQKRTGCRDEQQSADPLRFAVMSPITMCFNRMLGAAEYIKTPAISKRRPHTNSVSRAPSVAYQQPDKKREVAGGNNPFDELAADPELERLVILQMAMQRQQHGNQFHPHGTADKSSVPSVAPRSKLISEGFFWREYPACEQVLYNHMTRYYEISAIQRNYKTQQSFNNLLVEEVRKAALDSGFQVDPNFDDKKLRDRIRCFYKTHLQNAKKRLATLQKHSDLEENRSLVAVFIRCVRDPTLTLEESLNMADAATAANKKQRRLDKVEKLKLSVKLHDTLLLGEQGTTAV